MSRRKASPAYAAVGLLMATAACSATDRVAPAAPLETPQQRAGGAVRALLRTAAADGVECVDRDFAGFALGWDAEVTQLNFKSNHGRPPTAAEARSALTEFLRRSWGGATDGDAVAPEDASALSAAAAEAAFADHPPLLADTSEAAAAAGLRTVPPATDCFAMQISAPVVAGEFVFVERHGATSGLLYALRRVDGEWRIAGRRTTWLS